MIRWLFILCFFYSGPLCERSSSRRGGPSDFILLMEDDAYPESDLFEVLANVLHSRVSRVPEFRSALFFKLYHPERLQGYFNPEPTRIVEWILLSAMAASLLRRFILAAAALWDKTRSF